MGSFWIVFWRSFRFQYGLDYPLDSLSTISRQQGSSGGYRKSTRPGDWPQNISHSTWEVSIRQNIDGWVANTTCVVSSTFQICVRFYFASKPIDSTPRIVKMNTRLYLHKVMFVCFGEILQWVVIINLVSADTFTIWAFWAFLATPLLMRSWLHHSSWVSNQIDHFSVPARMKKLRFFIVIPSIPSLKRGLIWFWLVFHLLCLDILY